MKRNWGNLRKQHTVYFLVRRVEYKRERKTLLAIPIRVPIRRNVFSDQLHRASKKQFSMYLAVYFLQELAREELAGKTNKKRRSKSKSEIEIVIQKVLSAV